MKSRPKKKRPLASKALSIELAKELQNAGSQSSSIVEELQGLLGNDIILLPIRRGSKKPIPKDWQNTRRRLARCRTKARNGIVPDAG